MVGGRRQATNKQTNNNMADDDESMEEIKQDKEMGMGWGAVFLVQLSEKALLIR